MSSDDHTTTRSFLVLACMHQGCLVVELDIIIIISSSIIITSSPHCTGDHPLLQPKGEEVRQYSVCVKATYHHNTSYPGSSTTVEGTSAHLLYGIAVISCAVVDSDDADETHSTDVFETAAVDSNSYSCRNGEGSSTLVLAACYFYDNLVEVLRVQL